MMREDRRLFMRQMGALALSFATPAQANGLRLDYAMQGNVSPAPAGNAEPSFLWLARNGERARFNFATPDGYNQAAWFLRDVRAGVVGRPNPDLLRLIAWTQGYLAVYGYDVPYDVHSGLRTPWTNRRTEGASRASMHLPDKHGMFHAMDYSARGLTPDYLSKLLSYPRFGGVGRYDNRNFVHADVGRIRSWRG